MVVAHNLEYFTPTGDFGVPFRAPAGAPGAQSMEQVLDLATGTLRSIFPNLLRCELFVSDRQDNLVPVVRHGRTPSETSLAPLASLRSQVAMNRDQARLAEAHLLPELAGGLRGSSMCALLLDQRALIGLILVEAAPGAAPFTSADVDGLEGIASLFTIAVKQLRDRASPQEASRERDRRSASKVQRGLMGLHLPADLGVKVDVRYVPALDVGGDFYELTSLGNGRVGGAIGDVAGKGVSAALIMSRVSSDIRRGLLAGAGPASVLCGVNDSLTDADSETFVTAACFHLDVERRSLRVSNAGHIPVMVRRANGDVLTFGTASGTPLGVLPCTYGEEELSLQPQDIAILMTDGVVEALDRSGDRMGTDALLQAIRSAPHDPAAINERILQLANAARGTRSVDDVTLVAVQIER